MRWAEALAACRRTFHSARVEVFDRSAQTAVVGVEQARGEAGLGDTSMDVLDVPEESEPLVAVVVAFGAGAAGYDPGQAPVVTNWFDDVVVEVDQVLQIQVLQGGWAQA